MKIRTFIDRPILAGVISVLILILGFIGLSQLPIEQFPEIAPPTVSVSATYTEANAETVQKSVVVPLEEALNGVENMMYMTSTASNNGAAKITVYCRQRLLKVVLLYANVRQATLNNWRFIVPMTLLMRHS